MKNPLLIAGIGNIFFGDDAFGSEVARQMMHQHWPDGITVEDFGIRSYDLAYALMDGTDAILIDVVSRGEPPGTLYLLELDLDNLGAIQNAIPDAHSMTPVTVLEMVRNLGGKPGRFFLLGCEPSVMDESEEGEMGLSAPVQAAVPYAIERIESLVADFLYDKIPSRPRLAGAMKEVS
jgi:hydrogenase maturation protease